MISPTHLYFLLGQRKNYETDGERMLKLILARYGLWDEIYDIEYCYTPQQHFVAGGESHIEYDSVPSKKVDRAPHVAEARKWVEACWHDRPGLFIGLGWMACEVLTGRGKTKLKDTAGTKWRYAGEGMDQAVWITYDPAACLFDPGVAVDISAVICAAGREVGLPMGVAVSDTLTSMNRIWRRYL